MKISELQTYLSKNQFNGSDSIDDLIIRLILDDKIESFNPIFAAYVAHNEKEKEYNKCELTEVATLLHLRRMGLSIANQEDRELHMLNKHSNMSCKKENVLHDYNQSESEKRFKEIYSLK